VKKITTTMMALALSATAAVAQTTPKPPATPAAPATAQTVSDPVIVSAGEIAIHQKEFENAIKTLPAEYQSYAMGPGKKQFADDYLRMKLLAAKGMKEGLANDPEVVNQLSLLRENLVANAEIARLEKSIKVSDEDLKKAYDANVKDYEQVTARHILIAFKGSPAAQPGKKELTEEEAKAKAEDLRKQIVAGADFAELAKKESDDTGSGSRGGDLGAFGPNQMVPEFEQAAFAAKVGEVTPVVRTQYGYHVIKVEKHDSTPFDQVKATLERAEAKKRLQDQLDALKAEAKPVYNDTYFAVPAAPPAAAAEAPASSPDSKPATTASPDMTSKKP